MFNVNWTWFIYWNLPIGKRKPIIIAWVTLLVSQAKSLHATFLSFRNDNIYKVRFTGQIIYLTKRLNDKWDSVNRGIYIDNVADMDRVFVYNRAEQQPARYLYNKWSSVTSYAVGDFVVSGTSVYKCIQASTNNPPASCPTYWQFHKFRTFIKNKSEAQSQYDFIVKVPVAVTFNIDEMKAVVEYYKLAGKRFTIQTY